ncbi:MAG: hypothetical protein IPJ79_05575 [Bacteroidetes bacterium]|nr:hypothetical protein [Bacteroidota bacterium]
MLQNPQVMNLLSNLASGLAQNSVVTPSGNNVPAQTVLNSISTLSGNAANAVSAPTPIVASMPGSTVVPLSNAPMGGEYFQEAIEVARMFS